MQIPFCFDVEPLGLEYVLPIQTHKIRGFEHCLFCVTIGSRSDRHRAGARPVAPGRLRGWESKSGHRQRCTRKAAVDIIAGELRLVTEVFSSRLAKFTLTASRTEPGNAHFIPNIKPGYTAAHLLNRTYNLVTENKRQVRPFKLTVDDMEVSPADSTAVYF